MPDKPSNFSVAALRNFYVATLVAWLVWILFLDNNNIRVVLSNRMKMKELENEKAVLTEKIKQKKKERNEVFGSPKMLEKWAREKFKMRKPTEEVYVIVDANNKPVESSSEK
ncbi:FtsB family cell division protein [Dyadobacter sandarakinus]|uniref:Septum formation initiator family protein n=1 Tax=Dyadobacter sandarakinus TaxID=2747268 RepID=A0ABX7I848_9BACT|nr:septum formation initiator family protein [Dyadobacter sandarakinus]QRR02281.1 septum formation initiator family protein [Dyadobacter sandarakinus]